MAHGTLATQLIREHLVEGEMSPGSEIGIHIDQTLTQDATGTLVMLELEAMGLDRVKTEVSAQYVDHNLIQEDHKNPDDHLFLRSAARRFGLWFARPGTGVSHPVHQATLGRPGATMLGSDSHTPAAGAIGMLAIGAGGIDVAMAMAGEPFWFPMPRIRGVRLVGALPAWVSAKDVVLEMLRRHGVDGAMGWIIEYFGPGLDHLSTMDRHVIANMGTEMGATTTVFPSDAMVRRYLARRDRAGAWRALAPQPDVEYDAVEEIDLSTLVPLIARPSSPGDVVPVTEVAGAPIYQAYIGSSANPGFRDFAVAAHLVDGRQVSPEVSFDINPPSRALLRDLADSGHLAKLIAAGARLHQAGCNGCIGMGQAPATGRNSLRTVPRNFPGRSGTREDAVWLCSPETAAASALAGRIVDPRAWAEAEDLAWRELPELDHPALMHLEAPLPEPEAREVALVKGPNIASLPPLAGLPDHLEVPVILVAPDDVSTDAILPAGARVLPFRSNIGKIAAFCFEGVDPSYPARAEAVRDGDGHAVVGGFNYGQGSSREHAALAPRTLGLRVVLAKSYARIHRQNLLNFGVLPLVADPTGIVRGDVLVLDGLHEALRTGDLVEVRVGERTIRATHGLSDRQVEVLLAGGLLSWVRRRAR